MQLLLTLILAHLFADFPLQTNSVARLKARHSFGVLPHVLIYVSVTALLIEKSYLYWPLLLGLGVCHFVIDTLKAHCCTSRHEVCAFWIDQVLHLLTMVAATYLAFQFWTPTPRGIIAEELLPIMLAAAFVPALMVCCWIWTTSKSQEYVNQSVILCWISERMLVVEQRYGLAVIGVVIWLVTKQTLTPLMHLAQR